MTQPAFPIAVKRLGLTPHEATWRAMQAYTAARDAATPDEIWLTEHPPVYTLGLAGKPEHLLNPDTGIPLSKTDRGGQITYHGPGQLMVYLLLDLKRRGLGVRALVRIMEAAVIDLLASHGLPAHYRADAPGVYVMRDGTETKIAALGLRVKNGCCYHGLALNIDMDLTPYNAINPCGYAGMPVTHLRALGAALGMAEAGDTLARRLTERLA